MDDSFLRDVLHRAKVIAVVGISPDETRPSHFVAHYLSTRGYRVIPVNPGHAGREMLGETVHADLASIPASIPVDLVDIFRRSDAVPGIVEQALTHLPALRTIWMQLGVRHEEAAARARERGVAVVEDLCTKMEYRRLFGDQPVTAAATPLP